MSETAQNYAARDRKYGDARDLPDGMMLVESFDLVRGGRQYSVTGPDAPRECSFKFFPTPREAVENALVERAPTSTKGAGE